MGDKPSRKEETPRYFDNVDHRSERNFRSQPDIIALGTPQSMISDLSIKARMVRLLLEKGADVKDNSFFRETALHSGAQGVHKVVVRLLLGACINDNNIRVTVLEIQTKPILRKDSLYAPRAPPSLPLPTLPLFFPFLNCLPIRKSAASIYPLNHPGKVCTTLSCSQPTKTSFLARVPK